MELNLLKSQVTLDTLIKRYEQQLAVLKDERQRNTLSMLIYDLKRVQATLFYYKSGVENEFQINTELRIKVLHLENEIITMKQQHEDETKTL